MSFLDRFRSSDTLLTRLRAFAAKGSDPAAVQEERHLLRLIAEKTAGTDRRILQQILSDGEEEPALVSAFSNLNPSQERALLASLRQQFEALQELCRHIDETLERQGSIPQESLALLSDALAKEGPLRRAAKENLRLAQQLRHHDWFRTLVRHGATLAVGATANVVLIGKEHIPAEGPVVFAPRHVNGNLDPSLLLSALGKNVFMLGATDWMKEGVQIEVNKWLFNKMGVVPINRPDSIFEHPTAGTKTAYKSVVRLLLLRQSIVIFPEGWPNIDAHWTRKTSSDEIIEVKAGIFHFIDYVQKKKGWKVPIVPIGLKYEKVGMRYAITVRVGAPMFIPVSKDAADFSPYQKQLTERIRELSQ